MSDDMDIIRGSGNVLRDLGHPDADREQLCALLAAQIIGVLDDRKLTVRAAHELTGVAAADFSRIRKANLGRFTIDRLMTILGGLGQEVDVSVKVYPRRVVSAGELTDAEVALVAAAEVPAEHAHLDVEAPHVSWDPPL